MMDEERDAIFKERVFYHVTPVENLKSIKATGLNRSRTDWFMYRAWLKSPAVFLCTQAALPCAKRMFEDGINRTRRAVLKVPATEVLKHECDVDHSFPDCTVGLTFLECLDQIGFIACYGDIPQDLLEVVEFQDERLIWISGE